jgi:hypothetical protein
MPNIATKGNPSGMRRTALLQVRLTEQERARWRAAATRRGMWLAEYVRDAVRASLRDEQHHADRNP